MALWPTLAACVVTATMFLVATGALTHRFEAWTYDDRRLKDSALGRIVARPPTLLSSGGELVRPWAGGSGAPRAYLVDFIYTSCPSICQALGAEFQRMQAALRSEPAEPGVRLLSVSFDLARDHAQALAAYARLHRADGLTWVVAIPASSVQLQQLLGDLEVVVIPDGIGGYVHNGAIHLLDAQGRLRGLFAYDEWTKALAAARHLAAQP